MTPHQKRRFPEKVEFMTSAGFIGAKATVTRLVCAAAGCWLS
jgi:hypothetical protein